MWCLLLLLFFWVANTDAILMTVGAHSKCISETYFEPKTVTGNFKWINGLNDGLDVLFEISDPTTEITHFKSVFLEGSFSVKSANLLFCFHKSLAQNCRGWRQTGSCNPHGPRETDQDRDCSASIARGMSGFCECQKKVRQGDDAVEVIERRYFSCDHDAFTCATVCQDILPPATVLLRFGASRVELDVAQAATTNHVEAATHVIQDLADKVREVKVELDDQLKHDDAHQQSTDLLNSMVMWMHMLVLMAGVVSGGLQLSLIVRVLKDNKAL
eukprot:c12536_g1_i3.p1 GENE.c12536_g1_i3~~c12536_g1_i3.p1  ORF type:complete len:283 (+),score=89.48 c12536_g1_i3:35-850(+)